MRRTKGENRRGRSHPLRCDRQRWYGGTRGREAGESAEKQLPTHWVTTPWHHTRHIPPTPLLLHFSFFPFLSSFRKLTPRVYFLLWWTDLCMPFLDSAHQSGSIFWKNVFLFCFFFSKLHDSSVEMMAAKEFKIKPRWRQTSESVLAIKISESQFPSPRCFDTVMLQLWWFLLEPDT